MVLLVVDTQNLIVTPDLYEYALFNKNVSTLIATARLHNIEVIYVQHDDGIELTKGVDEFAIYHEFSPKSNEKIFIKYVNSAFRDTGLAEYLKDKGETQVMIVGLQTDYCIDATIKAGFEHHLEMIVPAYCNTTFDNEYLLGETTYHYYNEKMWNNRYAKCISFEEAISYLKQ
ncbi:MAG TPA: isochorismatase family protein [Lachnospiraceae bacterium]|nr:isochorismatase family protein [Lachnospiraceae bacterium]